MSSSRLTGVLGTRDDEGMSVTGDRKGRERGPGAGAGDAEARVRNVHRAVGGADQVSAVLGEELVGPPVQRRSGVRAAVHVGEEAALVIDDEALHGPVAAAEAEPGRLARDEEGGGAAPAGSGRALVHGVLLPNVRDDIIDRSCRPWRCAISRRHFGAAGGRAGGPPPPRGAAPSFLGGGA